MLHNTEWEGLPGANTLIFGPNCNLCRKQSFVNTVPDFLPNQDNVIWKKFKAPEKIYELSSEREMDILTKPETVFTTLHFLRNLRMDPIRWSVT